MYVCRGKTYTFDDDFGGSYTFDDSESQPTLLMIPPYRDVPAARKHKGSVGTSWIYEIDVLRAKDESADLLSCQTPLIFRDPFDFEAVQEVSEVRWDQFVEAMCF
eukprot:COSAG01_NODE_1014_length_12131_cov_10.088749_6_plen_105_part_00